MITMGIRKDEIHQPLRGEMHEEDHKRGSMFWYEWSEVSEELKSLAKIAIPIIATSLLLFSKSIISMLFLGHLGEAALAGGSLAIGFANITGYSIIKGLSMGMEPICGQAFGASKWTVLSHTYQKAILILLVVTIPISTLWANMEPILLWLGQDPTITAVAQVYIQYSLPDLLAQANLHPLRIFLRTQNLTTPLTASALVATLLHVPINYLLVVHFGLGVKGVALASGLNTVSLNVGLFVYLLLSKEVIKPWCGASLVCLKGWRTLVGLAVPSAVSVCLEWWWYEVILLMCGLLDDPKASVASMGVLVQTIGLVYVLPSSLGMGLSTRVGHELGACRPSRAQRATRVGMSVAAMCGATAFAFTLVVKHVWGKMFTSEPQILALTSVALPIIGFCELGNCPQTVGCGVLRGSARPVLGANINFGSFYLVGLPVAAGAGFWLKYGFLGLWFGLLAAQATCAGLMLYAIARTDWVVQAERAKELTMAADGERGDLENNLLS